MKAELLSHTRIDLSAWDELVDNSHQGSVFMKSWYISTLVPDWKGVAVYEDKELVAVMPLAPKKKFIINYSLQPVLAKYWGVAFLNKQYKNTYEEYNWKKKILEKVIAAIPRHLKVFGHNFHPGFDYALPFSWEGYNLQTKYTFKIDLQRSYDEIASDFLYKVRSAIKKAEKEGISIHINTATDELLQVVKVNAAAGKPVMPAKEHDNLQNIFQTAHQQQSGFSLSARLGEKTIASSLFVLDKNTTYCILAALDPAYRDLHAIQLLISEAIKRAQLTTKEFDFLGASMRSLEFFFRRFGPRPVPYIFVSRNQIPLFRI